MTIEERTDGRLSVVEIRLNLLGEDVKGIRGKIDEFTAINAERREVLRNIIEAISELRASVDANSKALQDLSLGTGVMKQKVAWLLAILLFVANFLGQGTGTAVRQALAGASSPPISSGK